MLLSNNKGFTLIELVAVISILGVLAALTYTIVVPNYRERTYYTRSISELGTMANGLTLYAAKYNDFPPDVNRSVPSEIQEFLQGQYGSDWPDAPFPGAVYDYDNWPPDGYGPEHTYQISIRFCNAGQDAVCKANAKKYLSKYVDSTVLNNWDSSSSMYHCIRGSCRSHQNKPMNHPGYCVNCGNKSKVF
jgi:prepilin-type N-terminal cleavage/methylation domain-containing protein